MSGFASIARNAGGGAGGSNTTNAASTTQFGEMLVAQLNPASQAFFADGINPQQFLTRSIGVGASVTEVSGNATLQSGTATTGSASVSMRKGVSYRAGQGSLFRGTALFGPPVDNTYKLIGFGNVECGYYFGYQGLNFGIHHFPDGIRSVWKLDVNAGGVANGSNVVFTLNGESKTYTINGGSIENQTAWEISQQDWTNVGGGWVAEEFDGNVYFIALRNGARTGSYSATLAGSPIGVFTSFVAGATPNATFISQSAWNIDTMDGNGPSRMVLDPTKGNVYQIGFQYLGYGNARFAIEDPQTGQFQSCHMIKNANFRTTPVLRDPHVTGIWTASNNGSTISTHMSGASGAIFVEGNVLRNIGPSFSYYNSKSNIDDNPETPVLSIRANRIFRTQAGFGEITPSTLTATVPGTGNHFMIVRIYKNARLTGPVNFTNVNDSQSIAAYDTGATGVSLNNGVLLATYVLPFADGQIVVDLKGDNYSLASGDVLTVTGQAESATAATLAVAITWFEDQ